MLGKGVTKDDNKAFNWWLKAAQNGHIKAMFCVGSCYGEGKGVSKDIVKAFEWFLKAAENGDTDSMHNVAYCYSYGIGVAQDLRKANEWRSKAEKPVDEKELLRQEVKKRLQGIGGDVNLDAIVEETMALSYKMGLI